MKRMSDFGEFGQTSSSNKKAYVPKPFGVSCLSDVQIVQSSTPSGSMPAFGTPHPEPFQNSAFGSVPTPAFGNGFAGFSTTGLSPHGWSGTAQESSFGGNFHQPQPAFAGSTAFGSSLSFGVSNEPPSGSRSSWDTPISGPWHGNSATSSGLQSSAFGSPTAGLGNGGFGHSALNNQVGGSRVASYVPSIAVFETSTNSPWKIKSVSAMLEYKYKCHEELRWEDYQKGDEGGELSAFATAFGQSHGSPCFGSTPAFSSSALPSCPSAFGASTLPSNPSAFGSSTGPTNTPAFGSPNSAFGAFTSAFGAGTTPSNTPAFGTPNFAFGAGTSPSNPPAFGAGTSPSNPPAFGAGTSPSNPPAFGAGTSPSNPYSFGASSAFGASASPSNGPAFGANASPSNPYAFGAAPALGADASPSNPYAFGAAPALGADASPSNPSAFGAPTFGASTLPSNTPAFGVTSPASPVPVWSGWSLPPATSTPQTIDQANPLPNASTPVLFGQTTPLFPASLPALQQHPDSSTLWNSNPSQPPALQQPPDSSTLWNSNPSQPAPNNFTTRSDSFGHVQPYATQNNAIAQPMHGMNMNTYGILPLPPQIYAGRLESTKYGITKMPVNDKPSPSGFSSPVSIKKYPSSRIRLLRSNYRSKVLVYSDEEIFRTPKADSFLRPCRENPRALYIKPIDQWRSRISG